MGYNCREYVSSFSDDDMYSVASNDSAYSSDEEGTPVPSDIEDAIDDMLEELDQLKLSKK